MPKQKKSVTTKQDRRKERGRRRVFNALYVVLIVCCIVVFSWTGYAASYIYPLLFGDLTGDDNLTPSDTENVAPMTGQVTVLLLGSDHRPNETMGRSDTLMVAFIDLDQKLVRLLSIPRDTYVSVPDHGKTKINHAYAYGGVDLTSQTLQENFGIKVDYYANVDFQGFRDVIDAVGGVTIDVPVKMYVPWEAIDLEPGLQELDGKKALQFVRFRSYPEGDVGRVDAQQRFMTALKDQVISAGTLLKIPDLSNAIINNVNTDIPGTTLLRMLMTLGSDMTLETYQPAGAGATGPDGISYYYLNESTRDEFFRCLTSFADVVTGGADTPVHYNYSGEIETEGDMESTEGDVENGGELTSD